MAVTTKQQSSSRTTTTVTSNASAERKRKFFQRRGTSSVPNSSIDAYYLDHSGATNKSITKSPLRKENSDSAVTRALEEALRTGTILGWDTVGPPTAAAGQRPLLNSESSTAAVASLVSRSNPTTAQSSPKGMVRGK